MDTAIRLFRPANRDMDNAMEKRPYIKIVNMEQWGIFLQSTGALLDTARSLSDARDKAREWARRGGEIYVDKCDNG